MKPILFGAFLIAVLATDTLAADLASQDVERAKQAARENQLLPGNAAFHRKALDDLNRFLDPLLEECALQDCLGAGMSNTYVVRAQADGTLGEAFVEPSNRFTACLATGLKGRARLSTPPPSDDYWISWAVSGIMRVPEGCRNELTPPAWHTLKWWLFLAADVFPKGAFRVRVLLGVISVLPFLLTLAAWKLLRPDDLEQQLVRSLALGVGLVMLAAFCSFAIGHLAREAKDENRENVLITTVFAFGFLSSAPFAARGLRRPRMARGSRFALPTAGPVRRAIGLLLLTSAMLPSTAMLWFAAHENVHRLCTTCVKPYKFRLLR